MTIALGGWVAHDMNNPMNNMRKYIARKYPDYNFVQSIDYVYYNLEFLMKKKSFTI
jgi:phage anti-repressor protein|tara:strand:- start:2268 stop:2435 length:168 start_codon:yes stop_codon:yes gene_type:complete